MPCCRRRGCTMKPPKAEMQDFGLSVLSSAIGVELPEDEDMEIEKEEVKFLCILVLIALVGIGLILGVNYQPIAYVRSRAVELALGEALVVAAILGRQSQHQRCGNLEGMLFLQVNTFDSVG